MVNQVVFQVVGCDTTIAMAAEAGQLELNVMMPVIAWNALHASTILRESIKALRIRCVDGITANVARARELLERSTAMATALSPYLGYATTADLAKTSVETGRPIRELVLERGLLDKDRLDADSVARGDDARRHRRGMKPARRLKRATLDRRHHPKGRAGHEESTGGATRDRFLAIQRDSIPSCPSCRPVGQQKTQTRLFPPQDLGLIEPADREQWQQPELILDALLVADGAAVPPTSGPLAGGSRSSWRAASDRAASSTRKTCNSRCWAAIRRRAQREGFANIVTVLGTATDPKLRRAASMRCSSRVPIMRCRAPWAPRAKTPPSSWRTSHARSSQRTPRHPRVDAGRRRLPDGPPTSGWMNQSSSGRQRRGLRADEARAAPVPVLLVFGKATLAHVTR